MKRPDTIRTAYQQLLSHGYNIYVPLQHNRFAEIIIQSGPTIQHSIIRSASLSPTRGPTLHCHFFLDNQLYFLEHLSIDSIIAVLSPIKTVWIVPISAVSSQSTIRLNNREEWLLSAQIDQTQLTKERILLQEATEEISFYQRILSDTALFDSRTTQ